VLTYLIKSAYLGSERCNIRFTVAGVPVMLPVSPLASVPTYKYWVNGKVLRILSLYFASCLSGPDILFGTFFLACLFIHSLNYTFLLTYLLHGAESFLRSWNVLSYSRNFPHFMEPEGSSPHSQELATCSYPEPDWSSPCPPSNLSKIYFNIFLPSELFIQ
jgi:hypothetical protein